MTIELQTNINLECEPVDPSHLVNIRWVEQYVAGKVKAPVRLVETGDLDGSYVLATHTFTLTAAGPLEIDGVAVAAGDRVLLIGQADASENGIYVVTDPGNGGEAVLKRSPDFTDATQIFTGVTVSTTAGDNHANTSWRLVTDPIVFPGGPLEFIAATPPTGTAKYAETIVGDGIKTEFEVEHNLGTQDVSVTIRNLTTHGIVLADVKTVDNNTIEVGFCAAPEASQGPYRVVVIG